MDDSLVLRKHGYTCGSSLGEGSYAKVKSAYSKRLKTNVAVKIINRKKVPSDFLEKFLPRELEILPSLNYHSIVKIFETFETSKGKVFIIMELCVRGNLLQFIEFRGGTLSEDFSRKLFRQLSQAIKYLHDMDVVHRDLKCENLLLDKDFHLKVSDFGFSRRLTYQAGQMNLSETYCGSQAYAAPEVLQGIPYNPKASDVWSMGVVLYIMLCGSKPYDDSSIKNMLKIQKEHGVVFPSTKAFPSEAKDIVYQMLHPIVSQRMKTHDILEHSWMQSKGNTEDGCREHHDGPSTSRTCSEKETKAESRHPQGPGHENQEGAKAESHPKPAEGGAGSIKEDHVTC